MIGLLLAAALATPAPAAPTVAVMPAHDLSGGVAPLQEVDRLVFALMAHEPVTLVPPETVSSFLDAQRIRYTGGLVPEDMAALRAQTQASIVIVVGAERYVAEAPPRVALSATALSTEDGALLGTADAILAGEQRPGLLGLGEVSDPAVLLERAAASLVDDLSRRALRGPRGRSHGDRPRPRRELRPAITSVAPDPALPERRPLRIAVLPFENRTDAVSAGEIVAGHVLRALAGHEDLRPLDDGTVRAGLLEYRVIQDWGVSLPQTDALRVGLDADLVVTGRVVKFADSGSGAAPQVAFSLRVVDARGRKAVWSSFGENRGDDGVVAFDAGRYLCAHALARDMAEAAVATFVRDLERKTR